MVLYFWCDKFENDEFESDKFTYFTVKQTGHSQTRHFQTCHTKNTGPKKRFKSNFYTSCRNSFQNVCFHKIFYFCFTRTSLRRYLKSLHCKTGPFGRSKMIEYIPIKNLFWTAF